MFEIKEMPYVEKLDGILSFQNLVEDFAPRLVNQELGKEKSDELRKMWENESEQIPEHASDKDKYEIAYRNLLQNWVTANNFMGKYKGEDGTMKYMRAAVSAWKRKYAGSAFELSLIGIASKKAAFKILSKRLAYQLQIWSPFSVSELDENHMTLNVSSCKIVSVRKRNDFCLMACQNIVPAWLEGQFNVKMSHDLHGENCTVTLVPF
jgi:hypothetical protein